MLSDLTILELGPKGDGVHRGPRGRVYVERTAPGDKLRGEVQVDRAGIPRAEIVEMLEASPHRQVAPCPHYSVCGNCTLQHLNQDYYHAWKTKMVEEAFRAEGLKPQNWLKPIFIAGGNRRRATFSAFKGGRSLAFGYYQRRSQRIHDIDSCLVADPRLLELRAAIKPILMTLMSEAAPVDVFLQISGNAVDVVLTGPIGIHGRPDEACRPAVQKILDLPGVARVSWRVREGAVIEPLLNRGAVHAQFGILQVALPPDAFMQPTPEGEAALVDAIMKELPDDGHFADLFSGCGTFSGPMLTHGSVDSFESDVPAVQALAKAARGMPLRVFKRDLFKNPLHPQELNHFDAVIFDPPRAGCEAQMVSLAKSRVDRVIGLSCNPATFARDARLLTKGGYRLKSLQIVDQFIWSHHVEVVGVFTKSR